MITARGSSTSGRDVVASTVGTIGGCARTSNGRCGRVAALPAETEEFCTSCGEWATPDEFNYDTGWCIQCSPDSKPRFTCSRCGTALNHGHRTTCPTCRQEQWYVKYADELELLIVAKGYTVVRAREVLVRIIRPLCYCCGEPIPFVDERAVFCKRNKECRSAGLKFIRLRKTGLTAEAALARVVPRHGPEVSGYLHRVIPGTPT